MTIDVFLNNCQILFSDEFRKILLTSNDSEYAEYWAKKKLNSYLYTRLSGDKNKRLRQLIAEKINGIKTPFYKSGIHEIQEIIYNYMIKTNKIF